MELQEYKPGSRFPGVVGRTVDQSSPAWPEPVRAQKGAPNILFFVLDDVGYGQLSSFGGLIPTPTLDRLRQHQDQITTAWAGMSRDIPGSRYREYTLDEVSAWLSLETEATVRSHMSNILGKLHLDNRVQATLYALQEGIVSLDDVRADG